MRSPLSYILCGVLVGTACTTAKPRMSIYEAAKRNDLQVLGAYADSDEDINATDADGRAALHWAAARGRREAVKFLLANDAEDFADAKGETAVHLAARGDFPRITGFLIDAGSDVNTADADGFTALHRAAEAGAAKAAKVLVERGASVSAKTTDGRTPLAIAVAGKRDNVAELLRAQGAEE